MAKKCVLVFDLGLNLGDNCRGFGLLKAFRLAHPELEVACWLTPEVEALIGPLLRESRAVDRLIVAPRSPKETYRINQQIIMDQKSRGAPWLWSACPPLKWEDGSHFDHVIPTGEPWFSAKLFSGKSLESPEELNHGQVLAELLDLTPEEAGRALPLFGSREKLEPYITLGLCRPDPKDPKQLPANRREKVWQTVLQSGQRVVAVDYQDWSPLPESSQVEDRRMTELSDKVALFNKSALHIGLDGGLLHFAASCGCPTLGFYAGPGPDPGRIFGPWPEKGPLGEHIYCNSFERFIDEIDNKLDLFEDR